MLLQREPNAYRGDALAALPLANCHLRHPGMGGRGTDDRPSVFAELLPGDKRGIKCEPPGETVLARGIAESVSATQQIK